MEDKTRGGQARGSPDNIRKSKTVKKRKHKLCHRMLTMADRGRGSLRKFPKGKIAIVKKVYGKLCRKFATCICSHQDIYCSIMKK